MNPLFLAKAAPWIAAIALAALLALMTNLYLNERDQFLIFRTSVKTLGEQAEKEQVAKKKAGEDNLTNLKATYEAKLPQIRAGAVAAYLGRVRNADSSGSPVRPDGAGIKLDDGTGKECRPDTALIEDAADDAAKVEAWRAYCTLNNCPIED